MRINGQWVLVICGLMVLITFVILNGKSPRIAVIDMSRVIEMPAARLAHTKMPAKAQAQVISRFTKCLPDVIATYAKSHHLTVISGKVLAHENSLDITNDIIQLTLLRLKHVQ